MTLVLKYRKKLRYFLEFNLARSLFYIFKLLSFSQASHIGGVIAENIGPHLKRSDIARKNLQRAIPEINNKETDSIIKDMWNNFGRNFSELPHIAVLSKDEIRNIVTIEGEENIKLAANNSNGNLYFTGHLANWEIAPRYFFDIGYPASIVYRKGNNPGIGQLIENFRMDYLVSLIPKGQSGSRQIIRAIRQGGRVGILVDQKMNDGIKANFFGLPAMTAPAIARLALKYNCPVLPIRVIRLDNAKFKVIVSPPLVVKHTDNAELDTEKIINNINSILESWIREYPGQWIWLHNRWPSVD